jgi:hypothetical protein
MLGMIATGCVPKDTARVGKPYMGPTESMSEVVAAINQNNARLPTLWSRGYFEANVTDRQHDGRTSFVNGDVVLLYRRPGDFRLVGKKDVAGAVFEAGSNDERYWLVVKGNQDTMWWGSHANIDRVDPSVMPIQPGLLLDVLGVGALNGEFLRPPVPVMRFNNDADAYMFVWAAPLPDRWAAVKEVWYDRQTKLPTLVILFDDDGRVLLRAFLSNHKPVEVEGAPREDWPKVATNYRMYFPEGPTTLSFELSEIALSRSGAPNDRSFAFPGERAGVATVIEVDQAPAAQPERRR